MTTASPKEQGSMTEPSTPLTQERLILERARELIKPSPLFRLITLLYAERKLLLVFFAHFLATMIVWQNFAIKKFTEQKGVVPEGANRYWWKVLAPSVEFGAMHAILFQLALLPLTMSRYTIAYLSQTALSRFFPFNRLLAIHYHLGYVLVSFVFLATVFFFAFFGLLCSDGEQAFCDKFTSEIMITGNIIIAFFLIVGLTSYFRYRIPYEVFYIVHHMVFLIYIVSTAHTFDRVQRSGEKQRSQNFRWYSASILYYICDRAAMYMNNRYRTPMVANILVSGSTSSRMILLKLKRPALLSFQPGQYAYLKISELDNTHWHPFSIASGPLSDVLEFYIEVYDEKSWTGKLWTLLENSERRQTLWVQVMGPYGTPLSPHPDDHSHCIAIGAGTGIVPMLSLLKQHVRHVLRLDAKAYLKEMHQNQELLHRIDSARQPRKGSLMCKLWKHLCGRGFRPNKSLGRSELRSHLRTSFVQLGTSTKEMRRAVHTATRSIYGVVFLIIMTVYGVSMIGFTYSWCVLAVNYEGMVETTAFFTWLFFALFGIISTCFWDANQIINYIDVAVTLVSLLVSWYWTVRGLWANFTSVDMINYTILAGYMTVRLWGATVRSRHCSSRREVVKSGTMEKLHLIWVTRSATLVSEIMPDLNRIWNTLVKAWGEEDARKVLCLNIYVTDPDEEAVAILKRQMKDTALFKIGNYAFHRPDLARIIEDHSLSMISEFEASQTLLAFCGSPRLAREVHVIKISNDISTSLTGNKYHQMEYVAESYGGYKRKTSQSDPNLERYNKFAICEETSKDDSSGHDDLPLGGESVFAWHEL